MNAHDPDPEAAARSAVADLARADHANGARCHDMLAASRLRFHAMARPEFAAALATLGEAAACQEYRDVGRRLRRADLAASLATARAVPAVELAAHERVGGGWGVFEMTGPVPERRLEFETRIPVLVAEAHALAARLADSDDA